MPKDPPDSGIPTETDAAQSPGGRQPQRPGQQARVQPHPGERDPETLPSREPEELAERPGGDTDQD